MIVPKNKAERKIYRQSCVDSYEQENAEVVERFSNIEDFYYSPHLGVWILKFKIGEDQEFETKQEMMDWLESEGQD